ncbi:hypothetical protein ScPMuIL_017326 [Solemya velum]
MQKLLKRTNISGPAPLAGAPFGEEITTTTHTNVRTKEVNLSILCLLAFIAKNGNLRKHGNTATRTYQGDGVLL